MASFDVAVGSVLDVGATAVVVDVLEVDVEVPVLWPPLEHAASEPTSNAVQTPRA
jgi:hypothetical protein